ncbi:MAG: hypothetical protein VYC72_04285, partial [Verrucomicrobiota bacterium]|nr:hypothetical protein [Verrucomicrobiota bacterium]
MILRIASEIFGSKLPIIDNFKSKRSKTIFLKKIIQMAKKLAKKKAAKKKAPAKKAAKKKAPAKKAAKKKAPAKKAAKKKAPVK